MRRVSSAMACLISVFAMGGCAMQVSEDGSEPARATGSTAQNLSLVTARETPSTLTLYSEAGLWGDSMTVQVSPTTNYEALRLVTMTEVQNAHLLSRISSLRLTCGSRDSQVMLYDFYNTGTSLATWSQFGKGRPVSCKAGQTVTVNLHQQYPELADNVGSVYFLAHARQAKGVGFSAFVLSNWNQGLGDLPDGATASQGPTMTLKGSTSFTLRQDLELDAWECGARGAFFTLTALMNQDRTFTVYVSDLYVDTGWGDSWGCRDSMKSSLQSGAADAATKLKNGLQSLAQLAGTHPRYYFVPQWNLSEFDLWAGGEAPSIVVTNIGSISTVTAIQTP